MPFTELYREEAFLIMLEFVVPVALERYFYPGRLKRNKRRNQESFVRQMSSQELEFEKQPASPEMHAAVVGKRGEPRLRGVGRDLGPVNR